MPMLTTSDGFNLYYVDEGPHHHSTDITLLIVPGWGGSTRWFEQQIDELTNNFRVVSYDPRGQGRSERTDSGQRMERLTKDLDNVIEALNLDRVVLVGWSLGVSTVLSYVDVFGCTRLHKAVFVCGGPKLINNDEWQLGFVDLPQAQQWISLQLSSMDAAADYVMPQFFAIEPPTNKYQSLRSDIAGMSPEGSAAICWNVLNQDYRDVLNKINIPALVVSGGKDTVIPAGNASYLAESLPNAHRRLLSASAHCPFIEEPDEFNSVLANFAASNNSNLRTS